MGVFAGVVVPFLAAVVGAGVGGLISWHFYKQQEALTEQHHDEQTRLSREFAVVGAALRVMEELEAVTPIKRDELGRHWLTRRVRRRQLRKSLSHFVALQPASTREGLRDEVEATLAAFEAFPEGAPIDETSHRTNEGKALTFVIGDYIDGLMGLFARVPDIAPEDLSEKMASLRAVYEKELQSVQERGD
ncbi:hypothetical protein [Nesterenkonia flava]|uniref:Uncharacterized protein n=1 Tax=Nesterenkonia flava TaxID=469799 RepID=A0ABU1FWR7_9MICC|nr:hypothetical protein [Nesterenkonia flava]MDR5713116.1 hypothetical protein [Nesterenkonia flava]